MNAHEIMQLPAGEELNKRVHEALVEQNMWFFLNERVEDWSNNNLAGLHLWKCLEEIYDQVGLMRMSDAPNMIGQFAMIGVNEEKVIVFTSSWMESLCKAFLLFENGYRGEYFHPEFERRVMDAPKVYQC